MVLKFEWVDYFSVIFCWRIELCKNEETKKTVVVGWYKNAEIYRMPQKLDNPSKAHVNNSLTKYHFATEQNQAKLYDKVSINLYL